MVIRIRWTQPALVASERHRKLGLFTAALLTPCALLAFSMAFWIIAADLRWTGDFFLTAGLFTHWQMWLYLAAVLLLLSRMLDRWAAHKGLSAALNPPPFADSAVNYTARSVHNAPDQ